MSKLITCGWSGRLYSEKEALKQGKMVREKINLVREKSVTKSGHPEYLSMTWDG